MAATSRKKYDAEFKRNAVGLAREPGNSASSVERDLGLYQGAIGHWKVELTRKGERAFPATRQLSPAEEEVRRLRKENERLKRERDILKKAAAYFSMDALGHTRS